MAPRRTLFHQRKDKPRSVSKIGLLLCLLLAGGVMVVPASSDLALNGKAKIRDLALSSGFISFKDCVVTPDQELACNSSAVGMPLPAALRLMKDSQTLAAEEQQKRQKAETAVRDLALEVDRLNKRLKQAELAASGNSAFPPSGEIRPTGLTVTNPSTGSMMNAAGGPQQESLSVMPPSEE
ncbi:MAG TPA: hypothetical protein VJV39_18425 [Dongiaceae bacterium]|nr:hypothetical protein [Dongiaceae bacterium]